MELIHDQNMMCTSSASSVSGSSSNSSDDEMDGGHQQGMEHGNSWHRRSLIEDAKFDTITNAEFEKQERISVSSQSATTNTSITGTTNNDVMVQNEADLEGTDDVFPVTNGDVISTDSNSTLSPNKKCTVMFGVRDCNALSRLFKHFENARASVQHVESRRSKKNGTSLELLVTFETARDNVLTVIKTLKTLSLVQDVAVLTEKEEAVKSPWFPRHITDLDNCQHLLTKYDPDLAQDHPGFTDTSYRERRKKIAEIAFKYKYGEVIPRIEYTDDEVQCWGTVYRMLSGLYVKHACKEHLDNFAMLERECGYSANAVPQLEDVSNFLRRKSGFMLRPVAGLLSARDFLASLAFRVFQCTQYVRHPSKPDHTVEPDCIHELLGHIPMLSNPNFAQFSQEIGLASLGASDEDIEKFATIYWFTVEFGLCEQQGEVKVYGAGLLSAYGEMLHAIGDKPDKRPFDPSKVALQQYDDQNYQEVYFICDSFADMKEKVRNYAANIKRPYEVRYDPYTQSIQVINGKEVIQDISRVIRGELNCLHSALARIDRLSLGTN